MATPATATKAPEYKQVNPLLQILRRMMKNRKAVVGAILLAFISIVSISAPYIATHDPAEQTLSKRLTKPGAEHYFGADDLGRDVFSRVVWGGRISLRVGFTSVGIALVVGGLMGIFAAFYGGWVDNLIMRFVDIVQAIPSLLLAIAIVASLGPGLTNVMIAVGIGSVPAYARVIRASVLTIRELDYVHAAVASGATDGRIMFRHILPNAIAPIIVQVTLGLATAILAAAGLSYLGLGAQPPSPEWGAMLSQSRAFIRLAPHAVYFPGLAILITVLSLNLVGDGLRDALDPRLKQ